MTQRPRDAFGGAVNLAPVEPLRKLGDVEKPYEESCLNEIVLELHNEIKNQYIDARRQNAEMGRLMSNVRSGKLTMRRDPLTNQLALVKPLAGKPKKGWHVYPLAQVNSSQLTSIWTLSRPRVTPRHFGNNNRAQIQHALIQKAIEHYDAANFDELFHQQQSLSMMDYGTSAIRSYYDDKLNTLHRLKPIIENVDQTVYEGFGFCRSCLMDGTEATFAPRGGTMPQCPQCGSYNISDLNPAQVVSVPQVVGAEEETQGDIGCELLPIPALNWDQRKMVQHSSYTQYRSEVPKRLVEAILGAKVAEESPDTDEGLRVINAAGTRGGSIEGLGQDADWGTGEFASGMTIMDEEWFLPEWYAGRTLPKDEKTVSGEVIPKGTPLEKIFPDALCVVGFNDMKVLSWVGNEKRRIQSGVYHIQSHSGVGKGATDAVEITEQLNIAHSAGLAILKKAGAGGGYGYDREVLTKSEAQALLKPDALVGIKMRGTQYRNVGEAITQFQHNADVQQSITAVAQLTNLLNICFQTTEFTQGVANDKIDINTLGGQQMLQAQNQQRSAAPLRMKGYLFARVHEDVLGLFRDHIVIEKWFGTNDKFALAKGRFISGSDMPEEIKCDFVPDSEMPTNTFTKQQAAINMAEKSQYMMDGGFVALATFSPRLAAWWTSMFPGVEIPLFDQTEILMVCQERIDKIAELSAEFVERTEISGYFPPPQEAAMEIVGQLVVPMSEENHIVKAEVLKEYLDDDEVKSWSPVQLAAVEELIQTHYRFDRDNRFRVPILDQEGQMGMAMQAAMAQQAMMRPVVEQEQEDAALQGGLQMLGDELQNELAFTREQEAKEVDADRGEQGKKADHKRKLKEIETQNERFNDNISPGSRNGRSNTRKRAA